MQSRGISAGSNASVSLQRFLAVFVRVFHSTYISINEPHFVFIAGLSHFFEKNYHPAQKQHQAILHPYFSLYNEKPAGP